MSALFGLMTNDFRGPWAEIQEVSSAGDFALARAIEYFFCPGESAEDENPRALC